jgi:hypothetical protein
MKKVLMVLAILAIVWALALFVKTPVQKPVKGVVTGAAAKRVPMKSSELALLTNEQRAVRSRLMKVFRENPVMVRIAYCESSWRHHAEDGKVLVGEKTPDVGVFQINLPANGEKLRKLGLDPHSFEDNVRYAQYLLETRGLRDWKSSMDCWAPEMVAKR